MEQTEVREGTVEWPCPHCKAPTVKSGGKIIKGGKMQARQCTACGHKYLPKQDGKYIPMNGGGT